MSFSRTEVIDHLYASTWQARKKEIIDNIFKKHVLWASFTSKGRVRVIEGGGKYIEDTLMYGKNGTFGAIGKGDKVSTNPTDAITVSMWKWKTVAGSIIRYRDDAFKNRGTKAISNMVADNIKVAEMSAADEMNREAFLDGTGESNKEIDGLQNIVADDPTASGSYPTVGGISVSGNSWWQNQYKDMSGLDFATDGVSWMSTMVNNCEDNEAMLDLIITSQTLYELYEQEVFGIQMVVPTEQRRNKIADLGFRNLWFKEIPVVYDKNAPWTDKMYFLNLDAIGITGSDEEWFELTPFEPVPGQPKDRIAYILITCNMTCNNRRRNGVLFNFS